MSWEDPLGAQLHTDHLLPRRGAWGCYILRTFDWSHTRGDVCATTGKAGTHFGQGLDEGKAHHKACLVQLGFGVLGPVVIIRVHRLGGPVHFATR